jgi:hypothetical protein
MGVITVRNLGQVRIAGDTPTPEEQRRISLIIKKRQEDAKKSLPGIVDDVEIPELSETGKQNLENINNYLTSPEFARLATEVGFAVGGAMTGGTLAIARLALRPALQTLYRSLGAGLGQATGAGIASTTFDPKEELSKDVLRAFAQGATFEAVGAAIPALIKKIRLKGVQVEKGVDEAEKLIKDQKDKIIKSGSKLDEETAEAIKSGQLTPGLISQNRYVDILENITTKSLFGANPLIKARKGAETLSTKFVDDFIDNYGDVTRNDYGKLLQSTISNNLDEFRTISKGLYANVSTKAGNVKVNIKSVVDEARKLLDEAKPTRRLQGDALKVVNTVLDQGGDFVSFKVANDLRSQFLGITRSVQEPIKGQSQRYAANLADKLTKAIDDMNTAPLSAEARIAYNQAQSFYKEGAEGFKDPLIKSLLRNRPDEVYKNLIKPERPGLIDAVSKVIARTKSAKEKELLRQNLQGTLLFDLKSQSIKQYKNLNGEYMLKNLNKFGDSVLNKIFHPQQLKQVRSLLNSLALSQRKTVGENIPGAVFIQLTQAGAVFGLFSGVLTGPSAALLLGPAVIAKLFTNPKVVNLLRQGFALKPGDPKYYRWGTRLINAMITQQIIDEEEGEEFLKEFKRLQ